MRGEAAVEATITAAAVSSFVHPEDLARWRRD